MSVLAKATQILDVVAESAEPATLTSVAQRLGQPRSSMHRLLGELASLGLLVRVGDAAYVPGPRLARWASAADDLNDLVRLARPFMTALRDEVGESVHLYVRQRDRRVCVSAVDGKYELRHFTEVGKPLPLSAGASGKVLLAFADETTRAQELRRVAREPVSPRAPTADELRLQLDAIRQVGWAMSFGEREEGLAAASVPVQDGGPVWVALSISGPMARLTADRFEELLPDLRAAAERIGARHEPGWVSRAAAGR